MNVNKIATLRNSRGGRVPSVLAAVDACLAGGAPGITVHPRGDERHITRRDTIEIAEHLAPLRDRVEFNVEGDPRPDLLELVKLVRPHQCTLVPVLPGEITSQAGWPPSTDPARMRDVVASLRDEGIRVSMFVDPDRAAIDWVRGLEADRVELYTEPFARAFERGEGVEGLGAYASAAAHARSLGLGAGGRPASRHGLPGKSSSRGSAQL